MNMTSIKGENSRSDPEVIKCLSATLTRSATPQSLTRMVICPATPSSYPRYPKILNAWASRCLRYSRCSSFELNLGMILSMAFCASEAIMVDLSDSSSLSEIDLDGGVGSVLSCGMVGVCDR